MLYVAKGITMSTSLLIQLMIARTNGAENFGIWSLFLNLSLIFGTMGDWGVGLNGPAMIQQNNGKSWAAAADYWRKRLSFFSGILLVISMMIFYPELAPQMILGSVIVFSQGFLQDWYDRGMQKPERAAYRQIAQGLLQVSAVALVILLGGSFRMALGAYACMAALTYLLFYRKMEGLPKSKEDSKGWLLQQFPVLAGWALYYITYNLPALLIGFLFKPEKLGLYASHYFIYATVGTFSVITMDIFMAKPNDANRKFWLSLSSFVGIFMILISFLYYPILFGSKGFEWDLMLNIEMVVLCGILGLRLYYLNGLLLEAKTREFGFWNGISFVLHVLLIIAAFSVLGRYDLWTAACGLIVSELLTLLLFSINRTIANAKG
jgi:O-antigen/teichoic acid export membrane protein